METQSTKNNPAHQQKGAQQSSTPRSGPVVLALGALGVVFGDIGTSCLYAFKECFSGHFNLAPTETNIFGILSLITWSLFMVITFKYVCLVLRADNNGEGGTFALMALVGRALKARGDKSKGITRLAQIIPIIAILGASALYAESIITPAISVLSAMEGIGVYTHTLDKFVIPCTLAILLGLFLIQSRGTASLGKTFGPITLVWFITIAVFGCIHIINTPRIILALNPYYAIMFFIHNPWIGFTALGSVVLVITGGEALYADMGHFGARPIRIMWLCVVFPALLLNYFGQGALLLEHPSLGGNPFYGLIPKSLMLPMVVLATMATVIASQAMISGVFSVTQQASSLGFLPRIRIIHTSPNTRGQIYVPFVNKLLMCGCLLLVLTFRTSGNLAGAYGIAVTAAMCVTSILFGLVAVKLWRWKVWLAVPLVCIFLCFDIPFLLSNLLKFPHGGWITILVGFFVAQLMITWRRGRAILATAVKSLTPTIDDFLDEIKKAGVIRVPGTVIAMGGKNDTIPMMLAAYVRRSNALQENVILIDMITENQPNVPESKRIHVKKPVGGFIRVNAHFGFMDSFNMQTVCRLIKTTAKVDVDYDRNTFFLGRESLVMSKVPKMPRWRRVFYAFLSRNAFNAADYFNLPPKRTIEIGVRLEI